MIKTIAELRATRRFTPQDEDQNARVVVRLVGMEAIPTVPRSRA
jgi:hypothetical protein